MTINKETKEYGKNVKKAKKFFKEELEELIVLNSHLYHFVLECFDKFSPDYFWDFSASSSGKYHPKISNKKHGLVLHTKYSVWWGIKLSESFGVEKHQDIIIASLLLHDLQKFGMLLDKDNKPTLAQYTSSHGPILAIQIEDYYKSKNITNYDIENIIMLIALHMGRWTNSTLIYKWNDINVEEYKLASLVHLADYASSRKANKKILELDNLKF